MRLRFAISSFALASVFATSIASAQPSSPAIGWQTEFSNDFHDVSGAVSIVDEDTLRFENFTYDGGGLIVYFYLGSEESTSAFSSGLQIGDDLFGTVYDGTQGAFTVDLPAGETVDGYHAISVWCVAADVSFGSGTFAPPITIPEPSAAALLLVGLAACSNRRSRGT